MAWEKRIKKKGVSFKNKKLDARSNGSSFRRMSHHEANQHLDPSVIISINSVSQLSINDKEFRPYFGSLRAGLFLL